MKKMYMKRAALFMGLAAMVAPAAMADGTWRSFNSAIKAPSFVKGWSGNFSAVNEGIGENYNGAFEAYQVVENAKAGKYTLTANAFYRYATNDLSKENMKDGKNYNAYIFLGSEKKTVKGLFEEESAPNDLAGAKAAFEANKYVNTIEFTLEKDGDLRFGIYNLGGRQDEWTAFDNFKLIGPDGPVALVNADFEDLTLATDLDWDFNNKDVSAKLPDIALKFVQTNPDKQGEYNGKVTGVFRKTNASEYNFGTKVTLPAGKYRIGVQSFFRPAPGNETGKGLDVKKNALYTVANAFDMYKAGQIDENSYPFLYVTDGVDADGIKPETEAAAKDNKADCFYLKKNIKNIFDEKLDVYPDNEPAVAEDGYVDENGYGWVDSGFEYQAAKCFINNPDLYRNYLEFELPAETTVWMGLALENRQKVNDTKLQYWNPARDFTLEKYEGDGSGVAAIEAADENAPVEYYNLQGVRVANPENGLYIVKQGRKVAKKIFK